MGKMNGRKENQEKGFNLVQYNGERLLYTYVHMVGTTGEEEDDES